MNNNQLTSIGVGVEIDIKPTVALYLLAVIALGSIAFFAAKKYIQ